MYSLPVRSYVRKDIRLVWFLIGSEPNRTKTIPQKSTYFWHGFEAEPASNLNQKPTKNRTNNYVPYVLRCTKILKQFSLIFGTFLVQICSWFGFKTIPKTSTFLWYGFCLVLVWFGSEPNQNHTKRISLRTYTRTANEYDGSICYFFTLNLRETDFRRNRCDTIHVPPYCYNGYLRDTIVK